MKHLVIAILAIGLSSSAYAEQLLRGPNVHFDTDKSTVINYLTLDTFARTVSANVKTLYVYCHTDSRSR